MYMTSHPEISPSRQFAIRFLAEQDRSVILGHLTALSDTDRDGRFHAYMDDDALGRYVEDIDFTRMILVGAFDVSGRLVGIAEAHLSKALRSESAEICVTVDQAVRRQGIGRDLAGVAQQAASARGAGRADYYYQLDNRAIARIAASFEGHLLFAPGYSAVILPSVEGINGVDHLGQTRPIAA